MIKYIFILLSLLMINSISVAQCDPISFKEKAIENLKDGFTYIKSFPLSDGKMNEEGEIEYSFVFSKGTKYMLTFIDSEGKTEEIMIELYDPNKSLIAKNKKGALSYTCVDTGVHYLKFSFKKNAKECGLAILSFKR